MPVIKELKIDFIFSGKRNFIFPALIKNKNKLILVDAGYPNMLSKCLFHVQLPPQESHMSQ